VIELKIYDGKKLYKEFAFGNCDEEWVISEKEFYEGKGFNCKIYYRRKRKFISVSNLFELLSDIIDDGNEHASDIMPELRKRIKRRIER